MKINMKIIVVMRKNMGVGTYVMVIKHGLYLDSDSIILSVCPKQSFLVAPTHLSSPGIPREEDREGVTCYTCSSNQTHNLLFYVCLYVRSDQIRGVPKMNDVYTYCNFLI